MKTCLECCGRISRATGKCLSCQVMHISQEDIDEQAAEIRAANDVKKRADPAGFHPRDGNPREYSLRVWDFRRPVL